MSTGKSYAIRLLVSLYATVLPIHGGWTPPEGSVPPPAVLTLDPFADPGVDGKGGTSLVLAPDGNLYGLTTRGGADDRGTFFRLRPDGGFTKLHDFSLDDGWIPHSLRLGTDGAFYGIASYGGANGGSEGADIEHGGTLFKLLSDGTFTKLHDFDGPGGALPGSLIAGPDGALYGTTSYGGKENCGTLFRIRTDGTFTRLHDFTALDGRFPGTLVLGPDGAFYGTAGGGGANDGVPWGSGTLFRMLLDGTFTKLHDLNHTDGFAVGGLVVGADALYGVGIAGGAAPGCGEQGCGTLFQLTAAGEFTKLLDFTPELGFLPTRLVVGPDQALYGSTAYGGSSSKGALFRWGSNGFSKVHDFDGADGANPSFWGMAVGGDGALYGATEFGGESPCGGYFLGCGTLFRLTVSGEFSKVHDFDGTTGKRPLAAFLTPGLDGALYAATQEGGPSRIGVIFKIDLDGQFATVHAHGSPLGSVPSSALTEGGDGALYGSTTYGGTGGVGTLFRLEPNGTHTQLHDFQGVDGAYPGGPLVRGTDGALYGTTWQRSEEQGGVIFRLGTDGSFTILHAFDQARYAGPYTLVAGPDGFLYGTTPNDGKALAGSVFRVGLDGSFTTLHEFDGLDGGDPWAALVVGPDGALYGSTTGGGDSYAGTLFRVGTDGSFASLHAFRSPDGAQPIADMIVGSDGALYGTTPFGGIEEQGTIYRLGTDGSFTSMHAFTAEEGRSSSQPLVTGEKGALYGVASGGGSHDSGTIFRISTSGSFSKLHDFDGLHGANPQAPLLRGPDGALYGSTSNGGVDDVGTLFRLESDDSFTPLHDFSGADGQIPGPLTLGPDGALYGFTFGGGPHRGGTLFKLVLEHTDQDGDGIADDVDACPGTEAPSVIDGSGCSIEQLVPCSGPWGSHGQYVSSMIAAANRFVQQGLFTDSQRSATVRAAARSSCGK